MQKLSGIFVFLCLTISSNCCDLCRCSENLQLKTFGVFSGHTLSKIGLDTAANAMLEDMFDREKILAKRRKEEIDQQKSLTIIKQLSVGINS